MKLDPKTFLSCTLSPPKTTARSLLVKGEMKVQVEEIKNRQAFQKNLSWPEFEKWFASAAKSGFKQAQVFTTQNDFHLFFSKKGTKILTNPPTHKNSTLTHNRQKQTILSGNEPFIKELGLEKQRDKFNQIEQFLKIVQESLSGFPEKSPLTVVDFGCGKAYLTFALYHYLNERFLVKMIGIDQKKDMIEKSNALAKKLKHHNLTFQEGSIDSAPIPDNIDLAIALHACNTATDAAIEKAVRANAKVILAAPCCQHELYKQVKNSDMNSFFRHGILKERVAALATDAARAEILSILGYQSEVIEFIDAEHTPKNLMIRAIKKGAHPKARERYNNLKSLLSISPNLEHRLQDLLGS